MSVAAEGTHGPSLRRNASRTTPTVVSGPLPKSMAVSVGGGRTKSFEEVLNRADMSLYRAKDGGRNRVAADLHVAA